jgi:hypothetical protein
MISTICLTILGWLPLEKVIKARRGIGAASASPAVQHGNLGIYFDSSGQNLTAEQHIAIAAWKSLEIKLDRLFNISDRLLPAYFPAIGNPSIQGTRRKSRSHLFRPRRWLSAPYLQITPFDLQLHAEPPNRGLNHIRSAFPITL